MALLSELSPLSLRAGKTALTLLSSATGAACGCPTGMSSRSVLLSAAPENQRLLSCYLLGVVERLESCLGAPSPSQAPHPRDVQEATGQLRRLRDLLRTRAVPAEQDVPR